MNKTKKSMFLVLIVLLIIVGGFLKDFIFININTHLFFVKRELQDMRSHTFFNFLNNFSFKQVYYMKYVLTAFFLSIYYILSLLTLKILNKNELVKFLKIIYVSIIAISLLFFIGGFIFGDSEKGYSISRSFIGPLESPLPLIFLLLAAAINNNQRLL
jgi:hypothetical protein